MQIRLGYYYCADPCSITEQAEVQEFLSMVAFAFIFVPDETIYGNIYMLMEQSECRSCLWSIQQKADVEKIVSLFEQRALAREQWKALDAKRVFYRPMHFYIEDECKDAVYDWIIGEWHDYEDVVAEQAEKQREIQEKIDDPETLKEVKRLMMKRVAKIATDTKE